jgi:hypothetical protein
VTARIIAGVGLVIAATMALVVFEQRTANDRILATLNDVNTALANQTTRSRDLEQQVAALAGRVGSLEKEVIDLRRRVVTLSRRPVAIARVTPPVDAARLAPVTQLPRAVEPLGPEALTIVEVLPITWATDWNSYQPAGIIARPAAIVLQRKLSDPAFLKKLYVGYAAMQVGDIITTTAALNRGGREANPLLSGVAHSPAALIGVKAAATVATIVTIEKLRERHPVAASVTLIAINATLAAVTINNVAAAGRPNQAKP